MVKKASITFSLLLFASLIHGQSGEKDPLAIGTYLPPMSAINLSVTYHKFQYTKTPIYNSFGFSAEGIYGKHIGFELGLSVGKDNLQTGLGILLLPFIFGANSRYQADPDDLDKYLVKSLYYLLFLEHINYHIKIGKNFQLIPHVSLLRLTFMGNHETMGVYERSSGLYAGGAAGMKAGLILKDKWLLNAYCEWSLLYLKSHPTGIQAGLNLGINIPQK